LRGEGHTSRRIKFTRARGALGKGAAGGSNEQQIRPEEGPHSGHQKGDRESTARKPPRGGEYEKLERVTGQMRSTVSAIVEGKKKGTET